MPAGCTALPAAAELVRSRDMVSACRMLCFLAVLLSRSAVARMISPTLPPVQFLQSPWPIAHAPAPPAGREGSARQWAQQRQRRSCALLPAFAQRSWQGEGRRLHAARCRRAGIVALPCGPLPLPLGLCRKGAAAAHDGQAWWPWWCLLLSRRRVCAAGKARG